MNPNNPQHHQHPPTHPQFPNPPLPHFPIPIPNPNPNSNPNPNFQPPSHNLSTALSALTNLIQLTEHTLSSSPGNSLTPILSKNIDDDFAQCPYNPAHRLPACSLFNHYLTCPNHLHINHLLLSLRYPHTLESSKSSKTELVAAGESVNHELCFSVDGYGDFSVNYFYKDCPGVVSLVQERDSEKRVFIVPCVLYMECEDFRTGEEIRHFGGYKILVSEFWLGRCEVERWNDYPECCSLGVLNMISNVCAVNDVELKKWVIVNSPRYGVVIDEAMRDHIVLLFKLCLKPMAKEAYRLVNLQLCNIGSKETGESNNSMDINFDCKFMNEILGWLVSQLNVLYGEVNGKHYAINMLKNCIVEAGEGFLLFPLEEKTNEPHAVNNSPEILNNNGGVSRDSCLDSSEKQNDESKNSKVVHSVIRLSQVAAAVAALYERMILERKIRAFRPPQPLTKHQIVAEHDYLTNKAREVRQRRPNYRSIVEHDGIVWQHSHSQETNRKKSKEELLAEERDYKRRRMSYRGKKMKRSTTEVMRGIIEEYMEEIKHAGDIGCLVKGSEEAQSSPHEPVHGEYASARGIRSNSNDLSDRSSRQLNSVNKTQHPLENRCESVQPLSSRDYKRQNSEAYGYAKYSETHGNKSIKRHDKDHISRSSSKFQSQRWSEDQADRKIDHREMTKSRHQSNFINASREWKSELISSVSDSRKSMEMNADELKSRRRGQRKTSSTNYENESGWSNVIDERSDPAFSDRYDPSNSCSVLIDEDIT